MSIKVFFSYSHRDEELRDELAKHLSILKWQQVISEWHDRQISAGSEWPSEINKYQNQADIILLLISADFLVSEFCWSVELRRAMERHESGDACVIPIILRPVDWESAPFGKLQALPKDAKPVTTWANQDEAFLSVAKGVKTEAEKLLKMKGSLEVECSSNGQLSAKRSLEELHKIRETKEKRRRVLESIYDIANGLTNVHVRIKQVIRVTGFSQSEVSAALQYLCNDGMLQVITPDSGMLAHKGVVEVEKSI